MLFHTRLTIYNTWYTIADETWAISPTHFHTFFYTHSIPIGIQKKQNKQNECLTVLPNKLAILNSNSNALCFLFDF